MLVGIHYCNINDGADCVGECLSIPARKELEKRKKERKEKRIKEKEERKKESKADNEEAEKKTKSGKEEETKKSKKDQKPDDAKSPSKEQKASSKQVDDSTKDLPRKQTDPKGRKVGDEVDASQDSVPEAQGTLSTIISKVTETMRGKSKSTVE